MLRLLQQYEEDTEKNYQSVLNTLSSKIRRRKGILNENLYEISLHIKLIEQSITSYQ